MWYATLRLLCKCLFRLFFRWRVEGLENIPQTGPVVLCSNHISLLDPPLIGSALNRRIYFMAKEELFHIPVFGSLIRSLGAFPVKRGAADRAALRKAIEILQQSKVLGIFPEGTRSKSGKLGEARAGASLIAFKGNAVVIPVAIVGPYRLFRPLYLRFGKPLDLSTYRQGKLTASLMEEVSQQIMQEIRLLMENRQ